MMVPTAVPFVDTNIIPDRNAGMGSLLWDLQHSRGADGSALLDRAFAFIDVGVSRPRVATALKSLLADDLNMDVAYVATERPEAVPAAHATPLGERAEKIRGCLSAMISSKGAAREVKDWHCVVDRQGKVSSIAYSYALHGNEIWESYFMGRTFMYAGTGIDFSDTGLDAALAPAVAEIEAGLPRPSLDGYRVERSPLKAGLAEFGIALRQTDVPQRTAGRQNVLFLGNVLNHYPPDERAPALDRVAASMEERDLVIVQQDEVEAPSIEVFQVKGHGARTTRERVRWIDTRKLEVHLAGPEPGSWRQLRLKPEVDLLAGRFLDCLGQKASSRSGSGAEHEAAVRRVVSHVFSTFFRASPVEETLRVATREALRRVR